MQVTVACPLLHRESGDGQILTRQPSSIVISKPMRDTASKQGGQFLIRAVSTHVRMWACSEDSKREFCAVNLLMGIYSS